MAFKQIQVADLSSFKIGANLKLSRIFFSVGVH